MTLVDFLAENPAPDESELKTALSGNLCRCTGYQNIIVAAMEGASRLLLEKDSDDDIRR
jgi:carbon-monoxide dehydrogenase small subunit